MTAGKDRAAGSDRVKAARRAFSAALGELEAVIAGSAPAGAQADAIAALEARIAGLEAERARLTGELAALRAARETDAEMIEGALTELRAVV